MKEAEEIRKRLAELEEQAEQGMLDDKPVQELIALNAEIEKLIDNLEVQKEQAEGGTPRPAKPGAKRPQDKGDNPMSQGKNKRRKGSAQVIADRPLSKHEVLRPGYLPGISGDLAEMTYTLDLEDNGPWFIYGSLPRTEDGMMEIHTTSVFRVRGIPYQATIYPARVEAFKGKFKGKHIDFMPGRREEVVLEALRKLAVEGRFIMISGRVGLAFSMNELRNLLASTGNSYRKRDIRQALLVLRRSSREVYTADRSSSWEDDFIHELGFDDSNKDDTTIYVTFNAVFHQSLMNGKMRLTNYERLMSYRLIGSFKLHKIISHYKTGLAYNQSVKINLLSFLSCTGLARHPRIKDNATEFEAYMQDMHEVGSLKHSFVTDDKGKIVYESVVRDLDGQKVSDLEPKKQLFEKKEIREGRKLVDCEYKIWPSNDFVDEIAKASSEGVKTMAEIGPDPFKPKD